MNWRGTPLVDLATIVSLIGSTHSRAGLHVRAELDRGHVPGRRHRDRRAAGDRAPRTASLPRRLELHHPPGHATSRFYSYFLTGPNYH